LFTPILCFICFRPTEDTRNHRKPSVASEDHEEVLDYGEEEKIKTEPAKFDWSRRILRLKNNHSPKDKSGKRWQRKVDKVAENINTDFMTVSFQYTSRN
jgi:hypothetical protein